MMNILLVSISARRVGSAGPASELLQQYVERVGHYMPCALMAFATEDRLLQFFSKAVSSSRSALILADGRGQQVSSEDFAAAVGAFQDSGVQQLILAVGPSSGWTTKALSVATRIVAFGRITLPHELAAVVAAEQLYRALTIRAGHPYHSGH